MEGRLSREAKGKCIALEPTQSPRTGRVKAQIPVNNERLNRLSLTLIGRVTNRSVQKIWSLITFFTELWKNQGCPVGSDLGNGMFQFQFESEADLIGVLERRPFHYAKWMVILQRWEPTTAASFPSLIPFWIKVQEIPIHLWSEETIKTLGEDIGVYETSEITDFSVRMRVQINGLLPLIKSSIIEYPNGDEVTATLIYERLEKHCTTCGRLDHEVRDCLVAKHQARENKLQEQSTKDSVMNDARKVTQSLPLCNAEAYQFSASKNKKTDHREPNRKEYRMQRHDARRVLDERRSSRPEYVANSRRTYKEPPRDWQNRHSHSSTVRNEDSHRNNTTRKDFRL